MDNIKSITDNNGIFKIIAIDHRGSLLKLLPKDDVTKFKTLCVREFAPYSTAALLDREYGNQARLIAQGLNLGVIWTSEKTGYTDSDIGRETILYKEFDPMYEANNLKVASTKLLLYYNKDAKNSEQMVQLAKKVHIESNEAGLPLLIEPITYPIEGVSYIKHESIFKAIEDLREHADILKLEFPVDIPSEPDKKNAPSITETLASSEPLLAKMTEMSGNKPWVLLSKGSDFAVFKECVKLSKIYGAKGYAVGRAVWQEIGNYKTWSEKENFIKTIAKQRMKELSDIYDVD